MITKLVMFDGEIETQAYFTYRMRDEFEKLGYEVLTFNLSKIGGSMSKLFRFMEKDRTALVCFNFHGHTAGDIFEDPDTKEWLWDVYHCPCFNIVVDHPYYYHRFLGEIPKGYIHISIDRKHDAYMKQYFPQIKLGPFLPLAGTQVDPLEYVHVSDLAEGYRTIPAGMSEQDYIRSLLNDAGNLPIKARPIDIVFTGNYTNPHKFDQYIYRNGEDYAKFYFAVIDELLSDSTKTVEEVIEKHLEIECPGTPTSELLKVFGASIFIDLYVRSVLRGRAVQTLADAGLKVAVFGDGWDKLECAHPENIIDGKNVDSLKCLQMIQLAKCSLNVMPWFKDGAHDRVFNTMLNGALLITDSSIYLREILHEDEDCIMYDLQNIERMPEKVKALLDDPDRLQETVDRAYAIAAAGHTWADRADRLHEELKKY